MIGFRYRNFPGFLFFKQTPLFVKMQSRNTTISLPSHMMYRQGFSVTDIIDIMPFIVYNFNKILRRLSEMFFREYGAGNPETVILQHGGGLSWWNYRSEAEIPSCTAGILPGLYHGEFSINNPDRYVGCVRSIINKAE